MSIPTSSISAVRGYLLSQIQATVTRDPNDPTADILVSLDEAGTNQPFDIVEVGDVHQHYSPEASVGSGGAYWLREDYTVEITVSVFRGGDANDNGLSATVFNRARFLAEQVITIVRSDPSLGHLVDRARPSAVTHQSSWDGGHMGRMTEVQISIDVMNTL